MPRLKRKPNLQLRKIVLEETNDGRDIIRFLKNVIVHMEDGPKTFGIRPQDFARNHKIDAARILAKLGFEEGKRYLRRTYVPTPFRRIHPEEEDGPKRDTTKATADLYRLVKQKTNDGADIMLNFIEIMKGYHPEFKPHLRMAAAKELVRQIEFDYEEEPTTPTPTRSEPIEETVVAESAAESTQATESDTKITAHHQNHTNHSSDTQPNPVHPTNPVNPASNHSSDKTTPEWIQDFANPYTQYAIRNCAEEAESIYHSIIRRSADQPDPGSARRKATGLIGEFNQFMAERDPEYEPIAVPDDLLAKSLTQRMEAPESYFFDPADFFDLDRDDFYYCRCGSCEECDELIYFFEFMRELQEDYDALFEDP